VQGSVVTESFSVSVVFSPHSFFNVLTVMVAKKSKTIGCLTFFFLKLPLIFSLDFLILTEHIHLGLLTVGTWKRDDGRDLMRLNVLTSWLSRAWSLVAH